MRNVVIACLALLLVLGLGLGCGSEDEQPAAGGGMKTPDVNKIKEDVEDATSEEIAFECADPECE